MYTQCPHCQTIFGVSEDHLSAAFGRVRCGQCHGQFNAKRHLLDEIPSPIPSNEPIDEVSPEETASESETVLELEPIEIEQSDEFEQEDEAIDLDLVEEEPALAEQDVDHIDLSALGNSQDDETQHEILIEAEESEASYDEIQLDLVEGPPSVSMQEPELPAKPEKDANRAELDEIFADLDQKLEELSESGDEPILKPNEEFKLDDTSDQSYHDAFGNPENQTEDDIRASIETIFAAAEAELIKTDENTDDEEEDSAHEIRLDEYLKDVENRDQIEIIREETTIEEAEASADDIDPEYIDFVDSEEPQTSIETSEQAVDEAAEKQEAPDELPEFTQEELPFSLHEAEHHPALTKQRSPLVSGLLVFAIIGLILGGLFQLALFRNVEIANKLPALKPYLVTFCQHMPCQFVGQRDVKSIHLTSRDVRSHPEGKNTILINAIFVNRASFAQPYPDIVITLSDLTTTVLAQRRFSPQEYLAKHDNLFRLMKPGKPVHISLEVLDPGNDAVNFQFEFL